MKRWGQARSDVQGTIYSTELRRVQQGVQLTARVNSGSATGSSTIGSSGGVKHQQRNLSNSGSSIKETGETKSAPGRQTASSHQKWSNHGQEVHDFPLPVQSVACKNFSAGKLVSGEVEYKCNTVPGNSLGRGA